jgi:hypothetical protein
MQIVGVEFDLTSAIALKLMRINHLTSQTQVTANWLMPGLLSLVNITDNITEVCISNRTSESWCLGMTPGTLVVLAILAEQVPPSRHWLLMDVGYKICDLRKNTIDFLDCSTEFCWPQQMFQASAGMIRAKSQGYVDAGVH